MTRYYKVLYPGGWTMPASKKFFYSLPTDDGKPGKWTRKIGAKPQLCHRGYHLTPEEHLWRWAHMNCVIYEAEYRGEADDSGFLVRSLELTRDKIACQSVRLIRHVPYDAQKTLKKFNRINLIFAILSMRAWRIQSVKNYEKASMVASHERFLERKTDSWWDKFMDKQHSRAILKAFYQACGLKAPKHED